VPPDQSAIPIGFEWSEEGMLMTRSVSLFCSFHIYTVRSANYQNEGGLALDWRVSRDLHAAHVAAEVAGVVERQMLGAAVVPEGD
jgi:hypothetical protein